MKPINPELVHEAMQKAPEDGQCFRQARAAMALRNLESLGAVLSNQHRVAFSGQHELREIA